MFRLISIFFFVSFFLYSCAFPYLLGYEEISKRELREQEAREIAQRVSTQIIPSISVPLLLQNIKASYPVQFDERIFSDSKTIMYHGVCGSLDTTLLDFSVFRIEKNPDALLKFWLQICSKDPNATLADMKSKMAEVLGKTNLKLDEDPHFRRWFDKRFNDPDLSDSSYVSNGIQYTIIFYQYNETPKEFNLAFLIQQAP